MATLRDEAFVGRQQEMGELKAALEDALSGRGRLVMLAGEPGIGKTRTAQELAAHAETRGAQVLWGWCYEEEGAPPFWPWVQPIRSYIQQRDPEQLQSEMGPGAADIAEVVSEVRGKLPGLEPPPALPPEQARFRLFDSITTFLKNAAQSQPLMLVLDDVHWADKPSLLLLQFLARQLRETRLLVVGCYRDLELSRQHPLSEALAQLFRLPVFQRKPLLGMSQEDSGQFIEMMAGIRPSPQLVETIHAHTEGNPFFLKEMTRLLSELGELRAAEIGGTEGIRIPQGVREAIGQRLNRLSEACYETLTIASIIGREFDFRLLRILTDEDTDEQLLGVIDEALEVRLVEELPGGGEHYRFSHALIQQALAEELSISRQVRWHARIGEALEELYGADGKAHAAELVHHFAKAQSVLGTDKLVYYSLLAGEGALAAYAYEEALTHFQRALTAKEGQPMDAEKAALLFGLGRAQSATLEGHRMEEAVATLSRAFDYYKGVGDVARAVAVAEYPIYPVPGNSIGEAELIARALTLVPAESAEAGRLLPRYGRFLGIEQGDYSGAQQAFDQALAIARHRKDVALEMRILADSASVDHYHLRPRESWDKCRRVIKLACSVDDLHAEVLARYMTVLTCIGLGDLQEVRRQASAMLALAERLRDRFWLSLALRSNEDVSRLEGDWRTARDFSVRGLAVAPMELRSLLTRALLEYEVGDFGQGESHLERLVEAMRLTAPGPKHEYVFAAWAIPIAARISGATDRLDIARDAAETVLSSPLLLGQQVNPYSVLVVRLGLALIAIHEGDEVAARQQYVALESQRGILVVFAMMAVDRVLGLLCVTIGQVDRAVAHFEDAVTFCRKAGYWPELAWSCCDYADALLRRNNPGDYPKANSLLEEALAISRDLGMRPLMERVIAHQAQTLAQEPAPIYLDGLTQREVEVLRLVGFGKSNRQIGEELFISLNTVERHVSNILTKTGTANRADATRYAIRNGLVS